jgi:hypothetical protein
MKPPRRLGRPPIADDDTSTRVGLTLPTKQFDALCKQARREDISVAEAIRRQLNRIIKMQKP